MGELADAKEPLSIFAVYGPVPPEKVAVTVPLLPLLQLTSVSVKLNEIAVGWPTVIKADVWQPLASCTVTV